MVKAGAGAVVALLLSSAAAVAGEKDDEAAIRKIISEQVAAWNAGDGTRYGDAFAADGAFTNVFGMVMYGSDAFAKRHRHILTTFFKGTTKKQAIRRIRFVTPDVAIVDIDNEVHQVTTMPPGIPVPVDGVLKTQLMQVFVRRGDRWWIEAYHNVDLKSAAPTSR